MTIYSTAINAETCDVKVKNENSQLHYRNLPYICDLSSFYQHIGVAIISLNDQWCKRYNTGAKKGHKILQQCVLGS